MRHLGRRLPISLLVAALTAACDPPVAVAPAATLAPPPDDAEAAAAAKLTGGGDRASRWKDTAVYVDGRAVGMLAFGELPIGLAPVWIEDAVSVPVKPGQRGPASRTVKARQYRVTDYLRALGVDIARVRELHIHGPKSSEVLIVPGTDLRARGDGLRFRFGGEVAGKAIPVVPGGLGNGRTPDKIAAVAVYVERMPPTLVRNVGFVLDGAPVTGIAYADAPVRGGFHVYRDDRLATILKRNRLAPAAAGGDRPLLALLAEQGVDTAGVVEAWIIHRERRSRRLAGDELAAASLALHEGSRAAIHVGATELPVTALALHSRPLAPSELPRILPEEDEAASLAAP
jgi:hypothetical protein